MWFEARVWLTIHRTVPTHSCKEAAEKNSIFSEEIQRKQKEGEGELR